MKDLLNLLKSQGSVDEFDSLRIGLASYATRVIHQETLFFLLPFYVRSTTLASPNVAFTVALAALAALACLDLTFDRWLRRSPAVSATFFFAVAYAALQLLLPLVARVPFEVAQPASLALALASALALVGLARGPRRRERLLGALPACALTFASLPPWLWNSSSGSLYFTCWEYISIMSSGCPLARNRSTRPSLS